MSNLIKVTDKDLEIKEWRNKRVVTVYDVAMLQRKVRKAHSFRCGMDSMFLTFN